VALTLVTGGTGFIGSHVTRMLVARGDEVVLTARSRSAPGRLAGLAIRTVAADIRDRRAIRRAMRGVDRVFHLAARALPLVVVNPAHVLGPGDPGRSSTVLVRRFMRRRIPAYVAGTLNIVGVQDVARGHLLADQRGELGERYILGNRNFTFDRLFADLGRLEETVTWYRELDGTRVAAPGARQPIPLRLAAGVLRRVGV
jgi:nucleoside-diphosphate-sugar epimerase